MKSAGEAWRESVAPERFGIFLGSSRSAAWTSSESDSRLHQLVMTTNSALAGALARRFNARGPHLALSSACTSAASAIALAADLISAGSIDAALAGGVDLGDAPQTRAIFAANGLCPLDPEEAAIGCLPFDRRSRGIRLGDGAAFLLLARADASPASAAGFFNSADHAPLISLAGWARGTDPADRCGLASPKTTLPRVLIKAMARAAATPDDLLYLHAHGNGNPRGDEAEAATLDAFASERSGSRLPVVLTKSITGHCLGATPAMEAVMAFENLPKGLIPPNPHLSDPLPAERLDLLRGEPLRSTAPAVCLVSFGLWGSCAALVLRRIEKPA